LRLPFEVVEEYISTPAKAIVARRLWEEGYTQVQISRILGVSQPTVNIYIKSPMYSEERILDRVSSAGIDRGEFLSLVERILPLAREGKKVDTMATLMEYSMKLLSELRLCEAHRRLDPGIPPDCRICSEVIQVSKGFNVIRALENAFEILSRERCAYILVPEVMMNIAYARDDARGLEDIAAFPGRITRVGRSIASVSRPAWGASRHLGRIILSVIQRRRDLRALANIKAIKCVESALKRMGVGYRVLGPRIDYAGEDEVIAQVSEALSEDGVGAVVDLGGLGLEPVTYIAGRDPVEVAERISQIARICAEELGRVC